MAIAKKCLKLITGEVVFGEVEAAENGQDILVINPYTAENGNVMKYMFNTMTESPKAIQVNPVNIVWSCPLDEFEQANKVYLEQTSSLILPK